MPATRIPRLLVRAVLCTALVAAPAAAGGTLAAGAAPAATHPAAVRTEDPLPVHEIEQIVEADGNVSNGVLEIDINRSDLHVTGPQGVPFVHGFQIQHELYFQCTGEDQAILNGDLALTQDEIQPVIDALLAHHIVFQAEHQHLYDLEPKIWFVHFRATGNPLELARAIHDVIRTATATPLPQHSPQHPTTPLPVDQLADILGGDATVGENGVVTVTVPRTDRIVLGGVPIHPELGVSTQIQFEPRPDGQAAAVPDFSMTGKEVQPVVATMRKEQWEVGCLYNQETEEEPQLYFSHMFRTGDPVTLAHEIRAGLDLTAAQPGH
ncbi:DUF1259 domain-containing protein [Kitasatospora sp. RB6PN24]|uniref:DUF1259 domain-containing protein n=1 Tax=Kitasatospora humi TaxID=2893891 RepID=UPI001E2A57DD|nr:DUF1259 domain-containing protein [Kitasatospora humi]MCC9306581.1 DUF1259 domain-containing protein [Kitasatospora humi]